MASPLVTSPPHKAVDPNKKALYTLRVSDKIGKSGGTARKGYTSVKLNYKPNLKGEDRTTTITTSAGNLARLTLADKGRPGKFTYTGQRTNAKKSYVLVFDHDNHTCTLEPVSASYNFNLKSTPYETNESTLEHKYPQIDLRSNPDDDGANALDDGAENPYDYRNFMAPTTDRDSLSPPQTSSAAHTPELPSKRPSKPQAPSRKPTTTNSTTKPKSKPKQPARRAKSPSQSPPRASSPPRIHLDRRASTVHKDASSPRSASSSRESSPSSPVGFEIDYGDSPPDNHKPKGLGLHLLDHHASGPISLRSAANSASPSSRLQTPHIPPPHDEEEADYEFDFGDTRGGAATRQDSEDDAEGEEDDEDESDADADADAESDHDVEPMDIGPPAQDTVKAQQAAMAMDEEDDLDDFEKAMMEGMESESESEEE